MGTTKYKHREEERGGKRRTEEEKKNDFTREITIISVMNKNGKGHFMLLLWLESDQRVSNSVTAGEDGGGVEAQDLTIRSTTAM